MADHFSKEKEKSQARWRALEKARARMKVEGHEYPIYHPSIPADEYYTALREYGERESRYMLEFLNQPSGPRPIIEYPAESWKGYKD